MRSKKQDKGKARKKGKLNRETLKDLSPRARQGKTIKGGAGIGGISGDVLK